MDKTLTFIIIGILAVCVLIISWAALKEPKVRRVYRWLSYGYVALLWVFLILLITMAAIY